MDISLHDAAQFIRLNSEINKDNITTSNLTVLDNTVLDINKVSYKTNNIYQSDIQQFPPTDLSSDDFLTSVSADAKTITTTVSNQPYGNGLYKFESSETKNIGLHNSVSFNIFSDTDLWDSEISNPVNDGKYYEGSYVGSHSLNNDVEFKGLWFSLELPSDIVLTKIDFTKTNTEETSFYCKIYIQDFDSNYIKITEGWLTSSDNSYTSSFPNNVKKSNKYFVVFQKVNYNLDRTSYLKINNFKFIGRTHTNIISFPNILQNKQDKLTTDYGLQIVDNNIQFDTVFMQMDFYQYATDRQFTLNRLPYKYIVLDGWKYRLFDLSIVDSVNENLIYSYILKVGTNDEDVGNYLIDCVPVFSYFSTSTVSKINYSVNFGDWVTIQFQRTTQDDDDECSVQIHKNCSVNIVSR